MKSSLSLTFGLFGLFTWSLTITPVNPGLTIPGMVANVLEIPIKILAYCNQNK